MAVVWINAWHIKKTQHTFNGYYSPAEFEMGPKPSLEEFVSVRISQLIVFSFLQAGLLSAHAQTTSIKFTEAYPGTKFDRPVFFGAFPGKVGANVILEEHQANALIVYRKSDGSLAKDTLYHLRVGQDMEQGLLGIAFHPDYANNHKYYISYTPTGNSGFLDIVEERIADTTGMKDSGKAGRILIKIDDPYVNHNGGNLAFGPKDGFLYYAVGDGGGVRDPEGNSQNVNAWLGKMHRIDVNGTDPGLEYKIPADNPFASGGGRPEIYAYGFRNPWRWSFDPLTGDIWVGDVGDVTLEEVDIVKKGGNYGWKVMEGSNGVNNGSMLLPVFTFDHAGITVNPNGPAIIGGVVYRANPASKYYGTYFTACYGTNRFWGLNRSTTGEVTATTLSPTPTPLSAFGTDGAGRIYACGINNGLIYYLDDPDLAPSTALQPRARAFSGQDRSFLVHVGGSLDSRAFAGATALEVHGLDGKLVGSLRRDEARLPQAIGRGLYVLKSVPGGSESVMLVAP